MPYNVSEAVRRAILDELQSAHIEWNGALGEVEFLERTWDLERLPSTDGRFKNAAGDIYQHRVNNDDWPYDWIYSDKRLDLHHCAAETFLKFLV